MVLPHKNLARAIANVITLSIRLKYEIGFA